MAMLNNFFYRSTFYLGCMTALASPNVAHAQNCDAPYEMVTRLFYPDIGSYTVWDTSYGEPQKRELFRSAFEQEDGSIIAVGEMRYLPEVAPSLMIVEFDKRGRKIRDIYHAIGGVAEVVKILPDEKGYIILVNRKGDKKKNAKNYASILFLNHAAKIIHQKNIQSKSYDLTATNILRSNNKNQDLVVSVTQEKVIGSGDDAHIMKSATILLLDSKGNETKRREYSLGKNSEIMDIAAIVETSENKGYIATGYFENDHDKKIGWVLRLGLDGSYLWQQEFSRGSHAFITDAYGYKDGDVLVAGSIHPTDSGSIGSWLARLDGKNGEVKWQRYYYSEKPHYSYHAQDIVVNADGVITFLMSAKVDHEKAAEAKLESGEKLMDYAHTLNISPRGVTLSGEAYFKGYNAAVNEMILGKKNQYIISGYTWQKAQKVFEDNAKKEAENMSVPMLPEAEISQKSREGLDLLKGKMKQGSQEVNQPDSDNKNISMENSESDQNAWLMIGAPLDTYTDPCNKK